jgi:hypothetical protein
MRLLKAGVPLHLVQRIMRHSTPILTTNTYNHLELVDMRTAIDRLPLLELSEVAAIKTGTEDAPEYLAGRLGKWTGNLTVTGV